MKELDAPITIVEGGRPKKISKQRAIIKNLLNRAISGNARAIANLFKLATKHHVNLNDGCDAIDMSAERLFFVQELLDDRGTSRVTSGLSAEQKVRFLEDFYERGFPYLTGKLRLAPDHPLNFNPPPKLRPSTPIRAASFPDPRQTQPIT